MCITDIIPDIHGHSDKLRVALRNLGWSRGPSGWIHPEPDREIVFLGDFIDRGADNGGVIRIVRDLMDTGKARAVMGNHELNALHFHTNHPETGRPLRVHGSHNIAQHRSFLDEYPIGAPETADVLAWMRSLPLFIEEPGFRAVHAAWIDAVIDPLRALTMEGVLTEEQIIRAADKKDTFRDLIEITTKGPEHRLPDGFHFTDKGEAKRRNIRIKWWKEHAEKWRDVAISVPDLTQLPDGPIPEDLASSIYPANDRPVFFGHYWLSGDPVLQGPNALCLDYSAGLDGPLVTYAAEGGKLDLENIQVHAGQENEPQDRWSPG